MTRSLALSRSCARTCGWEEADGDGPDLAIEIDDVDLLLLFQAVALWSGVWRKALRDRLRTGECLPFVGVGGFATRKANNKWRSQRVDVDSEEEVAPFQFAGDCGGGGGEA